jgi:hypothetical protein
VLSEAQFEKLGCGEGLCFHLWGHRWEKVTAVLLASSQWGLLSPTRLDFLEKGTWAAAGYQCGGDIDGERTAQ